MTSERRPCACRGSLEADPKDPVDVERAVRSHQAEPIHSEWWAREKLMGDYVAAERVAVAIDYRRIGDRKTGAEPIDLATALTRVA